MDAKIEGGSRIKGSVLVSGAKNAALPLLAASIIGNGKIELKNVPKLRDVREMLGILNEIGIETKVEGNTLSLEKKGIRWKLLKGSSIRASILILGPLAVMAGKSVLPHPGGCSIGKRPIDIHIMGLKKLGISVEMNENFVSAKIVRDVHNAEIFLPFPSVGATEHLMITSCVMENTKTKLFNCAKEPEIVELQRFLNSMGANVKGAGTSTIEVEGRKLTGTKFTVMSDRIEAGTYLILSLASKSRLTIENFDLKRAGYLNFFEKIGAKFVKGKNSIEILPSSLKPFVVKTAPYPGFPTDLQPQLTVLACTLNGETTITDEIFEDRFSHLEELKKMGAHISREGNKIHVNGPSQLRAATLTGKDLRQAAALVIAAAIAKGTSTLKNFDILFRGYEDIERKLKNIGVNITLS